MPQYEDISPLDLLNHLVDAAKDAGISEIVIHLDSDEGLTTAAPSVETGALSPGMIAAAQMLAGPILRAEVEDWNETFEGSGRIQISTVDAEVYLNYDCTTDDYDYERDVDHDGLNDAGLDYEDTTRVTHMSDFEDFVADMPESSPMLM